MTLFTSAHWRIRTAETAADGQIRLMPWPGDPDPNVIGLDQIENGAQAIRVRRPAVRKSWLDGGPAELQGHRMLGRIDYDLHGDGGGRKIAYEKGRGSTGEIGRIDAI